MLAASLQNVSSYYGAETVLQGVTFQISEGQKLGLIGANGSGKTTVLRIMVGQQEHSAGQVVIPEAVRVGYVPQFVEHDANDTAIGFLLSEYNVIAQTLREQEQRLEDAPERVMSAAL